MRVPQVGQASGAAGPEAFPAGAGLACCSAFSAAARSLRRSCLRESRIAARRAAAELSALEEDRSWEEAVLASHKAVK